MAHKNPLYKFEDNKLTVFSLMYSGQDALEPIETQLDKSTVETIMQLAESYLRGNYSMDLKWNHDRVKGNCMSICEKPSAVGNIIALDEKSIDTLLERFAKSRSAYRSTLAKYQVSIQQSLEMARHAYVADYIANACEANAKLESINRVIEALELVAAGKLKEAHFAENRAFYEHLTPLFADITQTLMMRTRNNPANDPRPEVKYMYAGLALTKSYATNYQAAIRDSYAKFLDYFNNNHFDFTRSICIIKYQPVAETSRKEINLSVLYPTLKADVRTLRTHAQAYKGWRRDLTDVNYERMKSLWKIYSEIKNKLILLGYSDLKVTKFLSWYMFGKTKLPYKVMDWTGKCEITKQSVAKDFLIDVRLLRADTNIKANIYYLHRINDHTYREGFYRYAVGPDCWSEMPLTQNQQYKSSLLYHKLSPLDFLTPMSMPHEDVAVYNKHRGYRPTPYMGVELEVCGGNDCNETAIDDVLDCMGRDFIITKHDGSIGGFNPFEIVTVPATLDVQKARWRKFMTDAEPKSKLSSYKSGTCGMHVHISRNSFTGLHLAKFMRFINSADNHKFITKLAQRGAVHYSRFYDKTLTQSIKALHIGETDHYDAVNTTNPHTIEVRIFRGNLAKTAFFKNLEFVHAVWAYTRECTMHELNYKNFLVWLFDTNNRHHKQYANLEKWLVAAGYDVSGFNIKSTTPPHEALRLKEERDRRKKIHLAISRKFKATETNVGRDSREELLASA